MIVLKRDQNIINMEIYLIIPIELKPSWAPMTLLRRAYFFCYHAQIYEQNIH